jgi:hypothetical protein
MLVCGENECFERGDLFSEVELGILWPSLERLPAHVVLA